MMIWVGRFIAVALAIFLVGTSFAPPLHAEEKASGYLDAVDDMPLMEGLHETGEGGIVFDKPNGRIVRSIAEGRVSIDAVRRFYVDTLPQLGWKRARKLELIDDLLVFDRETERLEIEMTKAHDGMTEVRFSIEPN
jgi:hypothetical protein